MPTSENIVLVNTKDQDRSAHLNILTKNPVLCRRKTWHGGYKNKLFMLSSAEHNFFPANKSKIANNCKLFFVLFLLFCCFVFLLFFFFFFFFLFFVFVFCVCMFFCFCFFCLLLFFFLFLLFVVVIVVVVVFLFFFWGGGVGVCFCYVWLKMEISLLTNMKMPTIVSRENFILS